MADDDLTAEERATLADLLRRVGRSGGRPRVVSDADAATMRRMYLDGHTVASIADHFMVYPARVYEAMKRDPAFRTKLQSRASESP
jgi:hypothetical protein